MPTKPFWKSKTFWSDVVTVVVAGLGISDKYAGTHIMGNEFTSVLLGLAGILGIYGRATANTQIGGLK